MADYTEKSQKWLETNLEQLSKMMIELELKDDMENIEKLKKKLEPVEAELKKRETAAKDNPSSSTIKSEPDGDRWEETQMRRSMQSQIESIPKFTAGSELVTFLADLTNTHTNFVGKKKKLEQQFVRLAIGRLDTSFATRALQSDETIETYDQLKQYLETHHGSKQTVYQALDELYDIIPAPGDINNYAIKLENAANALHTKLKDKFRKNDKNFDARGMIDLMAAQIFVRNLKSHSDPMCYNSIITTLDECWDVPTVATHARSYLERAIKEDQLEVKNAFFGRKYEQPNEKKHGQKNENDGGKWNDNKERDTKKSVDGQGRPIGICWEFWKKGKCSKVKCGFLHNQTKPKKEMEVETPGAYAEINPLKDMPGFYQGPPAQASE